MNQIKSLICETDLARADEHADVHARVVRVGVGDVDHGQRARLVLVAEGGARVVELAAGPQEGPGIGRTSLNYAPSIITNVLRGKKTVQWVW